MSIKKISQEDIEIFSLETNISRSFISSSSDGTTDKIYLYPRRSSIEKELIPLSTYSSSFYQDGDIRDILNKIKIQSQHTTNYSSSIENYLNSVNSQISSPRKQQTVEIIRFTPGYELNKDFLRKNVIQNTLMPYYRSIFPSANYGFTNYNSINFFTASSVPSDSVLLFPQQITNNGGNLTGSYIFSDAFTFDFWIKPTYTTDLTSSEYKTGTIIHLSSSYAVSLLTGSSKDINGFPDKFRILLQLSSSTDIKPSEVDLSSLGEFVCVSEDNSLEKNTWQHVTIRWGTQNYNNGSGSILINKLKKGNFCIPSSSVAPKNFTPTSDNPTVMCVGNYYEGTNNGTSVLANFFTTTTNTKYGLMELVSGSDDAPVSFDFTHPLNAELHELKIYSRYLPDSEISLIENYGPEIDTNNLIFYLPPFFARESPTRDVLTTPFFTETKTTKEPFNVDMSFDIGGFYPNLENYTKDFAKNVYPRLWKLTGSVANSTMVMPESANEILYHTSSNLKRLLTILPNNNGLFYPNFDWLKNLDKTLFKTDLGTEELGFVSLLNLYPTSSLYSEFFSGSSMMANIIGSRPETSSSFSTPTGRVPTILQRTHDNSSYQVVIFDISNLYYGQQIEPNSLTVFDYLSGSDQKISMTLIDDGNGNVFRSGSSAATWNNVGNVFYNEGIIILKNPSLYFFGEEYFSIQFKGRQTTHILKINCYATPLMETSSSNPTFIQASSSLNVNAIDKKYVYITELLLHDDNLNVIGRTKMAQPLQKRTSDKILFKFSVDF